MAVKPFRVKIPESVLADLRDRIARTRWPDELAGSGWEFGASLSYMKDLADYWLKKFDWRKIEKEINSYPNFLAEIDGHSIHFLHVRGKREDSLPLIVTHGWPGSFLELLKLVRPLTENSHLTFTLVIPSLLGYGFSEKMTTPGCDIHLMSGLWLKLMNELGYEKFGAQGGDFGSGVCMALAMKHPRNLLGIHLNNIEGYFTPSVPEGERLTEEEIAFEKDAEAWYEREGAYCHLQKTKPLTLAYGLTDSPVGLCAWFTEKFYGWSDCQGDIESVFTKDEILSNVTLYWVTESLHSSIRLYHESRKFPLKFKDGEFVKVPVAIARFPAENPFPPRKYVERNFNVQRWTEMPSGGHFAAMEKPGLLAQDILEFFRSLKEE